MEFFLQSKIEKNLQLEMALDEIKDAYRLLEQSMKGDDRSLKQKVSALERSIDQISAMYQQAVNEKSILKVDLQTKDKKLQKSLERQHKLELKFEKQRSKNEQLEKIVLQLRSEFLKISKKEQAEKDGGILRQSHQGSRIAIKGGGGKRMQTPRYETGQKPSGGQQRAAVIQGG